jgi:hypothetical protein
MRAKLIPHAHGNRSLGRVIAVAIVFIAGMYALAAALIGMM